MTGDRTTAITFGLLLISGIVTGILSSVPALEYPDYLVTLSSKKTQVLTAVFFQAAMAAAYLWIAVLPYPVLKKYDGRIALGYFGFRMIGAAFLFAGIVSLLSLLFLSRSFAASGRPDSSYFQTLGELLRSARDRLNHIGMILPWSIGGLLLYYGFFRMRLVPGWLSVWGIAGSALTLTATFLFMFDVIKLITPLYFLLNAPAALFELVLAVFLVAKGFNAGIYAK